MISINTNLNSLQCQNNLTSSSKKLSVSLQRMSSGMKINYAKDDAANCTISSKLKIKENGYNIANKNIQDGISYISTAQGALNNIVTNLNRMRDLALQASDGAYSTNERLALQKEADESLSSIIGKCLFQDITSRRFW